MTALVNPIKLKDADVLSFLSQIEAWETAPERAQSLGSEGALKAQQFLFPAIWHAELLGSVLEQVPLASISKYLGGAARLESVFVRVDALRDGVDTSQRWHTDQVGRRVKVFVNLLSDWRYPIYTSVGVSPMHGLIKSWGLDRNLFRRLTSKIKVFGEVFDFFFDCFHTLNFPAVENTYYLFDTDLPHRQSRRAWSKSDMRDVLWHDETPTPLTTLKDRLRERGIVRVSLQFDFANPASHAQFDRKMPIGLKEYRLNRDALLLAPRLFETASRLGIAAAKFRSEQAVAEGMHAVVLSDYEATEARA